MVNCSSFFTSSWDDGHPLDLRVADCLYANRLKGTFFVPVMNIEMRPVLKADQLRFLSSTFEVGSHTLDHSYLNLVEAVEANRQVTEGKAYLEQIIGSEVRGFCYPGGKHSQAIRSMVKNAGFEYARIVSNFDLGPRDRFRMPTTVQFYPHNRRIFLQNYILRGSLFRIHLIPALIFNSNLKTRLISSMEYVAKHGGIFHLWGHSWELDLFDGWGLLDEILGIASSLFPVASRLTNLELARLMYGPYNNSITC